VVEYEQKYGGIILDCSQIPANIVSIKGEASRSEHQTQFEMFCIFGL
jgi:hypothetical protein